MDLSVKTEGGRLSPEALLLSPKGYNREPPTHWSLKFDMLTSPVAAARELLLQRERGLNRNMTCI